MSGKSARTRSRAKQRKRHQHREPGRQAVDLVVVMELDGVSDPIHAQNLLSHMGLPPTPVLAAGNRPALAVLRSPRAVDDCVFVADGERMLGVLHGTDCALSTYVRNQLGTPLPKVFEGKCARRTAGGVFRVVDISELGQMK
jgi:hypothetical protein